VTASGIYGMYICMYVKVGNFLNTWVITSNDESWSGSQV